jgi:hypothetical protein
VFRWDSRGAGQPPRRPRPQRPTPSRKEGNCSRLHLPVMRRRRHAVWTEWVPWRLHSNTPDKGVKLPATFPNPFPPPVGRSRSTRVPCQCNSPRPGWPVPQRAANPLAKHLPPSWGRLTSSGNGCQSLRQRLANGPDPNCETIRSADENLAHRRGKTHQTAPWFQSSTG